jgi:hypothetical protein
MNGTIDATEPEPIILAFSDGRRYTLEAGLTRRIWKQLERGHYSGPEELIQRALDTLFEATSNPAV